MATKSPQRHFKVLVNNTFSKRVLRVYIELNVDKFSCEAPNEEETILKRRSW
jgi:hypothetical protein